MAYHLNKKGMTSTINSHREHLRLLRAFHSKGIYFVNFATAPAQLPQENFVPSFAEEGLSAIYCLSFRSRYIVRYRFYDPKQDDGFLAKVVGRDLPDNVSDCETDNDEDEHDDDAWLPC